MWLCLEKGLGDVAFQVVLLMKKSLRKRKKDTAGQENNWVGNIRNFHEKYIQVVISNGLFLYLALGAKYPQTSDIRSTLVSSKIVDHTDVVGASPVGADPIHLRSLLNTWLQ